MLETNTIYFRDCLEALKTIPNASVNAVITDPPFNIKLLNYSNYEDNLSSNEYVSWCEQWLSECYRVITGDGTIMVMIGDEFAAEINVLLKKIGFKFRNWIIW